MYGSWVSLVWMIFRCFLIQPLQEHFELWYFLYRLQRKRKPVLVSWRLPSCLLARVCDQGKCGGAYHQKIGEFRVGFVFF